MPLSEAPLDPDPGGRSPPPEPLPPTARRCEFAGWEQRANGQWRTRVKPELFALSWLVANLLIIVIAVQKGPSPVVALILAIAPTAFASHAIWLVGRRIRLRVEPGRWLRWERLLGGALAEVSLQELEAIQLVDGAPVLAADGSPAPRDQQALLVFAGSAARREVLVDARAGSPEEASALAHELAEILRVPLLDMRRAGRSSDS